MLYVTVVCIALNHCIALDMLYTFALPPRLTKTTCVAVQIALVFTGSILGRMVLDMQPTAPPTESRVVAAWHFVCTHVTHMFNSTRMRH